MISGITVTSGLTAPVSIPRQTHRQTAPSIFYLTTTCSGRHLSALSRLGTGSSDSCPTVLTNLLIAASNMLSVEVTAIKTKHFNGLITVPLADPRGRQGRDPPPVQFLSFSCSFRGIFYQIPNNRLAPLLSTVLSDGWSY